MRRLIPAYFLLVLLFLPFGTVHAASAAFASYAVQGATSIQMNIGETKQITLKFRNAGTSTWKNSGSGYVSLYATGPYGRKSIFYGSGWRTRTQVAVLAEKSVKPGATGSVTVKFTAPQTPGTYQEQFQLASENSAWVSGAVTRMKITVVQPPVTAATPVHAPAYFVMNAETGETLAATNSDQVRSIASITKLMTTLVLNDVQLNPDKVITLQRSDEVGGGRLRVSVGTELTVQNLFASMLVSSANNAANALARATDLPKETFVQRMNEKAAELGMTHSGFVEPTGIEAGNVSTAKEVAIMAQHAFAIPGVTDLMSQPTYYVTTLNNNLDHDIKNTDALLKDGDLNISAGKTGFTYEAGYTFAGRLKKSGKPDLIVVVLGCTSTNQSFQDTKVLAEQGWAKL